MSQIALCSDGRIKLCTDGKIKLGCGCSPPCIPDCIDVTGVNIEIGLRKSDGTTASYLDCTYHGWPSRITVLASSFSGTSRTKTSIVTVGHYWKNAKCLTPTITGVVKMETWDPYGVHFEFDLPIYAYAMFLCAGATMLAGASFEIVDYARQTDVAVIGSFIWNPVTNCDWISGTSVNDRYTTWTDGGHSPYLVLPAGWGIYSRLGTASMVAATECTDCNPLP